MIISSEILLSSKEPSKKAKIASWIVIIIIISILGVVQYMAFLDMYKLDAFNSHYIWIGIFVWVLLCEYN